MPKSKLLGYAVQHGSAVLNGCVTFLVLKLLTQILPHASQYSQVSVLFLLFSTYLVLLDLGSHAEFLTLKLAEGSRERFAAIAMLAKLRAAYVAMGLFGAIAHALIAGFSPELFQAMLIYIGALFPMIVFSVYDTHAFACGQVGHAVSLRLARLLASGLFLLAWWWWPEQSLIQAFGVFSLSCFSAAAIFLLVWQPQKALIKAQVVAALELWKPRQFLRSSLRTAVLSAILIAAALLFHAWLVRQLGETRLAHVNTALAVSTPFSLFFQTCVAIYLPRLFRYPHEAVEAYAHDSYRLVFFLAILLLSSVLGLYGLFHFGLIEYLFGPRYAPDFTYILWCLFGLWCAQLAVPYCGYAIYRQRQGFAIKVAVTLILLGFPLLHLALQQWEALGYFIFLSGFWLVFAAVFYLWLQLQLRRQRSF